MTRAFFVAFLFLAGCASATDTYTPSGQKGYAINCSGTARDWGACYSKAGDLCGSRGYDIITQEGDQETTLTANQFGLYGGSSSTRSLVIACKP